MTFSMTFDIKIIFIKSCNWAKVVYHIFEVFKVNTRNIICRFNVKMDWMDTIGSEFIW